MLTIPYEPKDVVWDCKFTEDYESQKVIIYLIIPLFFSPAYFEFLIPTEIKREWGYSDE